MSVVTLDEIPMVLRAEIEELPSLPGVVTACLDEIHDPNSNAQRVADLMLADVGLTARALRLVNSSLFALATEVRSLSHAIALLGVARLEEVIMSVMLPQLFGTEPSGTLVRKTWEHSFGVAFISRELATRAGLPRPTDAYVAGLMHDLGLLVEIRCLPAVVRRIATAAERLGAWELAMEAEELQTDHTQVGACLATQWQFPAAIAAAVQHHHRPTGDPMVAIVHIADRCADAAGLGLVDHPESVAFDLLQCCEQTPGLENGEALLSTLHFLDAPDDWAAQIRSVVSEFVTTP